MRALILGGTGEARELASLLTTRGYDVTSSLAGRVRNPKLPVGAVRIGGFGGPAGLAQWLLQHEIDIVIDATHPFAERISASAAQATLVTDVPLIALHRPAWEPGAKDRWISVASFADAARLVAREYHHILLTIGRQHVAEFAGDPDNLYVIRCVEQPSKPLPARHRIILDRGPFQLDDEIRLMKGNQIDALVTKNSGGTMTAAKLDAARHLGVAVVMIERPPLPQQSNIFAATTPEEAWKLIKRL
ncbi:cobalt-precorrin-6A reductase [Corynebacterium choanae]|uniref:Precorrin-6A reductase n=1 Tax=Corynebacterium choanae TaxID=1862358 RepID=A0A3G6J706_9CORY|nr:cobalt-precorrin-6A reductase [Corynebacterium choanae]AZA13553.1 Precorrin-6A reductase [Corynebacterium choanae]